MKTPEEWVNEFRAVPHYGVGSIDTAEIRAVQADARAEPEAALASLRGKVEALAREMEGLFTRRPRRVAELLRAMLEGE